MMLNSFKLGKNVDIVLFYDFPFIDIDFINMIDTVNQTPIVSCYLSV
ncbi:hypothetical protein Vspart_01629 [Vibrio spartinae]|uniref:Uncharacterized protein n=1 Tax=Vibrio spartinae TaxID=1918945 RepID=A0A1N6M337_9VIBR|nr:hypothetical protein Vspart_01629 [Vibrio spartinae]SIO93853.1 hypothetical protein VSP9026_01532 [Vibrio spartinae]